MPPPPPIGDDVLRRLEGELPPPVVAAWFTELRAESRGEDGLLLHCPSSFHRDRIRSRWMRELSLAVKTASGRDLRIEFKVGALKCSPPGRGAANAAAAPESVTVSEAMPPRRTSLTASVPREPMAPEPGLTFDNFVVGPCNSLAREASLALVRGASRTLRQLYLCAPTGLGKTHLCRALAAEADREAGRRVLYTSAENFTSEFMASLRGKQTNRFKQRYRRDCDVLILEDVQFLEGKKATQLELFHTVQHLLDSGKRVVVSGNRVPRELTGLDERVRSQLASGLVAPLEDPSAEVRRRILRSKAAGGGVFVPPDCIDMMVEAVRGSVRDLEGVLVQLVTTASLLKRKIDVKLTEEALATKTGIEARAPRLSCGAVIHTVARFFQTTPEAMASRSRRRDVLVPRQLAMYLCHRYTDATLAEIGRALGRDHPAVGNAIRRVEREILERAPLRYKVEALCERLLEDAKE